MSLFSISNLNLHICPVQLSEPWVSRLVFTSIAPLDSIFISALFCFIILCSSFVITLPLLSFYYFRFAIIAAITHISICFLFKLDPFLFLPQNLQHFCPIFFYLSTISTAPIEVVLFPKLLSPFSTDTNFFDLFAIAYNIFLKQAFIFIF